MTSSLEDFVVSHLKKHADILAKVPVLAERALRASAFVQRLTPAALAPPDVLAAAALQWSAHRELLADLAGAFPERIRIIQWERLQEDLVEGVIALAEWLRLRIVRPSLEQNIFLLAGVHAKVRSRGYGVPDREREVALLHDRYATEIHSALKMGALDVAAAHAQRCNFSMTAHWEARAATAGVPRSA